MLESILRVQDRRTSHDGKLISLLGDTDPVIRERATRAYGSIQDSQAISLLIARLSDSDPRVQEAAAFALGQTAALVSPQRQALLENELIWKRLPDTQVPDRLLEEIGKFGSKEGLADLMIRLGNAFPDQHPNGLVMAIARYAIRGITSPDAVRYLLRRTRPAATPWRFDAQRRRQRSADLEHLSAAAA
jgi:HEAT repeat protein